jgi:hypothetical protein
VDSANAVRQFLERHEVSASRIQAAWDAISLQTTRGGASVQRCRTRCAWYRL